jgi:cytochrome c-type biogenesis protein CcmF
MTLGRYTLVYDDLDYYETESKTVVNTSLSVYNGGEMIGRMVPEKYFHRSFEQSVTEVAIRSTLAEDLYVILIGWEESGATSFKVVVNPLVSWIWIGGGVMMVGGLISFWPDRRRPPAPDQTNKGRQ